MNKIEKVKAGHLTFYFGVEQGTQEWLDLRRDKITCSNALTLLNSGPNACLAENRRSAARMTPNGNSYAERGHIVEDEVRSALNGQLEASGFEIKQATFITNDKYPNAGYSPDGLIVKTTDGDWTKQGGFVPVEIKSFNDYVERNGVLVKVDKHKKCCESLDNVPTYVFAQVQMEMLIAEAEECFLIFANPDADEGVEKVHIWNIKRSEVADKLAEKLSGKS